MKWPKAEKTRGIAALVALLAAVNGCGDTSTLPVESGMGAAPNLPEPDSSLLPTINIARATGWADGETPTVAPGLEVNVYADGLDHPRWLYVLPNGDVLVAETNAPERPDDGTGIRGWFQGRAMKKAGAAVPSANRITLLRDDDGDGRADQRFVFIDGLHSPFGMSLVGSDLYVANTDALLRFDYRPGVTRIDGRGETIVDLPAGPINHHWTKNVLASADGAALYVTVGSNSNVAENGMAVEANRAAILEVDPVRRTSRVFADGLRNPNGLAWQPQSGRLWAAVNERDELGNNLVPDYITSVKEGAFYGWPYSYYGQHVDERVEPRAPDQVARATAPDYALGSHTASLGLTFDAQSNLPARYRGGAFVGQHGSWNREPRSGYKVIFVRFDGPQPASGLPVDILTDFVGANGKARGRPVGVTFDGSGALLVADDVGNTVWRVSGAGK